MGVTWHKTTDLELISVTCPYFYLRWRWQAFDGQKETASLLPSATTWRIGHDTMKSTRANRHRRQALERALKWEEFEPRWNFAFDNFLNHPFAPEITDARAIDVGDVDLDGEIAV